MKNYIIFLLLTVLFFTGCSTNTPSTTSSATARLNQNWSAAQIPYSDSVVCTLKMSASTEFWDGELSGKLKNENQPLTLTFVGLNSDNPSMVGNLGDNVSLAKLDNGSTVYLMEKTGAGNINLFTLFRDKNILLMTKQYEIVEMPFGLLMIGDCLSGT